jgi:hypothetical protein
VVVSQKERLEKIKEVHLERIKQNEFYTASFIHVDWLIEQAEKVEELEKRAKEQVQNNYCIICGDNASEVRKGSYYCHECCN